MSRVIVATHSKVDHPIKVLESREDYKTWLDKSPWDDSDLVVSDCQVTSYK